MKDFKYTLMIAMVAFLIGARADRFGMAEMLRAVDSGPTFRFARSGLIGSDKPAHGLPPTDSGAAPARTSAPEIRDADGLSRGSVEEYSGEPGGETTQGSGYADVFDSDGHLLWRFATVQQDNSKWTILKYFSDRESKRRNDEAAQAGN